MSITRESNASVPTPALTTQSRGLAERSIKRRHVYTARVRATTQTHPTANCGPYPPVVRIPPESVITVWSAVCNLASNLSETDLNQAPACITKSRPFGEGRVSRVASLRGSRTPAGYQCRSARTPPRAESSSCPHPPRSLGSGSAALEEASFSREESSFSREESSLFYCNKTHRAAVSTEQTCRSPGSQPAGRSATAPRVAPEECEQISRFIH